MFQLVIDLDDDFMERAEDCRVQESSLKRMKVDEGISS